MKRIEFNIHTGVMTEVELTEEEVSEVLSRPAPKLTKGQRTAQILRDIGCVNVEHLKKDIFVAEAFAQMAGEPLQEVYESNVVYRMLIDARSAIQKIEEEP